MGRLLAFVFGLLAVPCLGEGLAEAYANRSIPQAVQHVDELYALKVQDPHQYKTIVSWMDETLSRESAHDLNCIFTEALPKTEDAKLERALGMLAYLLEHASFPTDCILEWHLFKSYFQRAVETATDILTRPARLRKQRDDLKGVGFLRRLRNNFMETGSFFDDEARDIEKDTLPKAMQSADRIKAILGRYRNYFILTSGMLFWDLCRLSLIATNGEVSQTQRELFLPALSIPFRVLVEKLYSTLDFACPE